MLHCFPQEQIIHNFQLRLLPDLLLSCMLLLLTLSLQFQRTILHRTSKMIPFPIIEPSNMQFPAIIQPLSISLQKIAPISGDKISK